jgi:hypothetical protein
MLLLVISIVFQYGLELLVFAGIGTLVVPINGFKFLLQRNQCSMHFAGFDG